MGLYLDPPDKAIVVCVDEKSRIQALDRTKPSLPLKKARAGTMTHHYKRHGTTSLFAALNVLEGTVIEQCLARHRHQEFLTCLRRLDRAYSTGRELASSSTTTGPTAIPSCAPGWRSIRASSSTSSRPARPG